jgi:hypothetical protein
MRTIAKLRSRWQPLDFRASNVGGSTTIGLLCRLLGNGIGIVFLVLIVIAPASLATGRATLMRPAVTSEFTHHQLVKIAPRGGCPGVITPCP